MYSPAGKADVPAPLPAPGVQSTSALGAVFVAAFPFRSAVLQNSASDSTEILKLWKLHQVTCRDFTTNSATQNPNLNWRS